MVNSALKCSRNQTVSLSTEIPQAETWKSSRHRDAEKRSRDGVSDPPAEPIDIPFLHLKSSTVDPPLPSRRL